MEPRTETSTVSINADASDVWRVLADEFLDNAAWAPGVISSAPNPATPSGINGSAYGGRVSDVEGLGKADIRLVDYDAEARMLSYTLQAEKVPPFIERLQNTWTVTPDGVGCIVASELEVTVANSMSESEDANKAVGGMFAQTAAALTALKTHIENNSENSGATNV